MKLMKIISIIAIIVFVSLESKALLPMSSEIDNMEILKLAGLDYDKEADDKAKLSFMLEKEQGGIGSQGELKKEYQIVMTYSAPSFNEAVRKMQFYSDKNLAGSHVKFFLIGEETARENIDNALEILAKDQEVRLSSHIYIVKDKLAKQFMEDVVALEYKLSEKLSSMEEKSSQKTIVNYITLSDVLSKKLSKNAVYMIPALAISSSDNLTQIKGNENEQDEKLKKSFDFYGYGIMKETNLISYINMEESIIYNMLVNKSDGGNIDIDLGENETISFGMNDIKTSYSFDFNNDKLKSVNIDVEFRSNFEEVQTTEDITTNNNILKYEKMQEQQVKTKVEQLIYKSQKLDADILGIGQQMKIKHPYKYAKLEKDFSNNYASIKVNINVDANIDRTYDIYKIN